MADQFEFSKNVPDVKGAVQVPIIQRKVTAQTNAVPDFQGAMEDFAKSNNNLSAIGVKVAQSASNAQAQILGYQQGKNPIGDLSPSITEFDKNFEASYHAQADATLRLQGQKLLEDANVEMSKPNRLTPDLIAKTNQQLQLGLSKIAENAPTAVRGQLEATFQSQVLNQDTQYKTKMIRDNKEDEKNNLINASDVSTKNILELASNNDLKGAQSALVSAVQMNNNLAANHYITPEEARIRNETAIQAGISGQYSHMATEAFRSGKYPEFEKNYAQNKPEGMTNEQYIATGQAFSQQVNFLRNLETQQNQLDVARFHTQLALNPNAVTPSQIIDLKNKLKDEPEKFEEVHLSYLKAMRSFNKDKSESDDLIKGWGDGRVMAAAAPKNIDKTFNALVGSAMKQGYSQDDAEVLVAQKADSPIPVLTKSIQNRLRSQDPNQMNSAVNQMHFLNEMNAGNVLNGLNKQDQAMYNSFEAIRDSQDPNKAAQELHKNIYSQDPDIQTANEQKLANYYRLNKPTGMSDQDFGLKLAGELPNAFLNAGDATLYGNDLKAEFDANFIATGGDEKVAKTMLQQSFKQNYGVTYINGIKQLTKHPIEKVLNLPDDATGVIQEDAIKQLQEKFDDSKLDYDDGNINEYWTITPRTNIDAIGKSIEEEKKKLISQGFKPDSMLVQNLTNRYLKNYKTGQPIEVIRHIRNGQDKKYTLVLKSNPFASTTNDASHPINGGWDVAVHAPDIGTRNISREAPYLGIVNYSPDVGFIKSTYTKLHPFK